MKISFFLLLIFYSKLALTEDINLTFVTEHLPPYQIIKENTPVTGFAVDLVHEIANRSGYTYQIDAFSWVRSYNLAQQKENHCIFSIARIPAREKLFEWVGTMTEVNNAVVWGLREKNIPTVSHIDELKDYLIAVNKNDVTHLGLLERGFKAQKNLYVLNNTDSLLGLLTTRPEINLIVADDITIAYRAELAGIDINRLERVFEIADLQLNFYLACNKNTDKKIINTLTQSLAQIHSDGFYKKTLSRWQDKMVHIN